MDKDWFSAAADEVDHPPLGQAEATAALAEHALKLVGLLNAPASPEELFATLDSDLKKLASVLYDKTTLSQINDGFAKLHSALQEANQFNSGYPPPGAPGYPDPRHDPLPLPAWWNDVDANSDWAVAIAFDPKVNWTRVYDECAFSGGGTAWKDVIALPKNTDGTAYEWRRMVPYLMNAITNRLLVIEAMDANWRFGRTWDGYLKDYAKALDQHFGLMSDGVQCGGSVTVSGHGGSSAAEYIACADINTGLSADTHVTVHKTASGLSPSYYQLDQFQAELKSKVLEQMPLFDMRSMVDALDFYVSHAPDLTETRHQIPVAANHNLCLDVYPEQNSSPYSGTQVILGTCKPGSAGQNWVYDRVSEEIYNPALHKCLRIEEYDYSGNRQQPIPGRSVMSADCGESINVKQGKAVDQLPGACTGKQGNDLEACMRYQRWTYDPNTQALSNGYGTVLDIQRGVLQAGTPLWIWDRNETPAQKWYVDPAGSFCGVACLFGS